MSKMCDEMIALREYLDRHAIKWRDDSCEYDNDFFIHRTKFTIGDHEFSVINGYGTYGGIVSFGCKNNGLLELMIDRKEPLGCLTAKEVEGYINECLHNY